MPFSYDSLSGYLLAYLIQLPCIYCILLACVCNFSYFVVSIVMLMAIASDLTSQSNDLTEIYNTEPNDVALYNQICSLVSLHTKSLQLSEVQIA